MKKRAVAIGFAKNFLLKLLSAFLGTGVRQFLTLPLLLAIFGKETYGTLLTINGVANIIETCLGNTLNNTRLVSNSEYEEKGYEGDYNCFVLIALGIGTVVWAALPFFFPVIDFWTGFFLWVLIAAGIMHAYYQVGFTMRLMFKNAFIQSVIVAIGTLVGVGLAKITNLWPFAFLTGHIFALAYLAWKTPLFREKLRWTPLAKKSAAKWSILTVTSALSNSMVYLDRLLLHPILGGGAVTTYTTAAFFGKCVSVVVNQASSVFLAYVSKRNFKLNRKNFLLLTGAGLAFCGCCYLGALLLAKWFTGLFYPSVLADAEPYFVLANAAAIIGAAAALSQTMVLRFSKTSSLLVIQILYSVVYMGGGLLILKPYGIIGFCWIAVISNSVRLIALIIQGFCSIEKK